MDNLTIIGVKVRVNFAASEVIGRVYAFMPDEDLLMLINESPQRKYTVVRITKDTQVHKLEDALEQPLDLLTPPVDVKKLLELAEDKPSSGEQIFTEISKTYAVEWENTAILLRDLDIRVFPPYESARDIVGATPSAVDRMAGVLMKVRGKLGLGSNS